jgi:D-amino-acid dehydrogenase
MSHVTIIGAGIIGVSAAAFLQRQGFEVTVIDRLPPGEGCSFGNAGGIAFAEIMPTIHARMFRKLPGWLMDPLGPLTIRWSYLPKVLPWFLAAARHASPSRFEEITAVRAKLGLRVMADFEALLGAAGARELIVRQEALRVFDSEAQFEWEAEEREIKARHGYPVEVYTGDEVREMEPALAKSITRGASHGGWYHVRNPHRVVQTIAAQVVCNGGQIIRDDVTGFTTTDRRVSNVTCKARVFPVDHLVVCAGAYSGQLAAQLGEKVMVEAERGYHMVLPHSGVSLSRSITYARTPGVATPMEMGLRLAGTDEFAGLEARPNYARADKLWSLFKMILPGLNPPDEAATRWMGRRPGTPDSLPVIGPSTAFANVYYGFGHGHMGLTWGPSTGRMIAEMMSQQKSNIDLAPFRADRF